MKSIKLWADEGVPDRRVGLLVGLIGGAVGALAVRVYGQAILPRLLPSVNHDGLAPDLYLQSGQREMLSLPRQYEAGETASEAAVRIGYRQLTGDAPSPALTRNLAESVQWIMGIGAGGVYGGTRTTTRARDIAGGFFYGIRLWLTDAIFAPRLGLRAPPAAFPLVYHVARWTMFEVYTLTMAAVTRILYKLVERAG